jgi:uncharacterized membrane-anchored protein
MSDCVAYMWSNWTCQGIGLLEFLVIMALIFGLFMVLAGVFTAYFGSGKSRTIGVVLLVVGIVVGLFAGYEYYATSGHHLLAMLEEAALILVASLIGALIAVGLFLIAIMKS